MTAYTTKQIARRVGGTLAGPGDVAISGVERIDCARTGQLTFIGHKRFAGAWNDCKASAALIDRHIDLEAAGGRALIRVEDADLAMATVLGMFAPPLPRPPGGIAPTACVDDSATLGREVAIGPGCVIARHVHIGDRTVLHANVCIYDETEIGAGCVIWSHCVIRERCTLGDGCILHPHVVIGADGFGYRPAPDGRGLVKIPQIGTVRIGSGVEIGAGSCVDRGKFSATVIGDGTKIDNLCQIGHNCQIGRCVVIAALTGVSGSVTIGDGAVLAGQVGIADHVTIGAGARLGAKAGVIRDIPPGAMWTGYPAGDAHAVKRQWIALQKLPDLVKIIRKLRRE